MEIPSATIQPLDILKWVGVVLAAGFVGYFGRYLAMLIIERMHRKTDRQASSSEIIPATKESVGSSLDEARLKLEKKRAKQEIKKAKKSR